VLGSVPIFEQEICEDIMGGGPCRGVLVDVAS
jgi:hypothetical protein